MSENKIRFGPGARGTPTGHAAPETEQPRVVVDGDPGTGKESDSLTHILAALNLQHDAGAFTGAGTSGLAHDAARLLAATGLIGHEARHHSGVGKTGVIGFHEPVLPPGDFAGVMGPLLEGKPGACRFKVVPMNPGADSASMRPHSVLSGGPGAGKTTTAWQYAEALVKQSGDSSAQVRRLSAADIGFIGQSTHETRKALDATNGGVLILDELNVPSLFLTEIDSELAKRPDVTVLLTCYGPELPRQLQAMPNLAARLSQHVMLEHAGRAEEAGFADWGALSSYGAAIPQLLELEPGLERRVPTMLID